MSTMELEGLRTDTPPRVKRCLWLPRRWALSLTSLLVASCGHFDIEPRADTVRDANDGSGVTDGPAPRCDPKMPFGPATPLGGLRDDLGDFELQLSLSFVANELTAYVALAHLPASGPPSDFDIYKATRATDVAEFDSTSKVGVSTTDDEPFVAISEDGKLLVFSRQQASADDTDLYESEAAADGSFSTVARLDAISEIGLDEGYPSVSGKDKTLYFTRYTDDVTLNDIYYSVRSGGSYGLPVEVPGVNTRGYESGAVVSESALQVVFDRDDAMYLGVRTGTSDSFSVTEFKDDSGTQISGSVDWMSADGCRLYYSKATYAGDTLTSSRFYVRSRSL